MYFIEYNREKAVSYAKKWANARNESYYNFDGIGGDCTNFASQCLFAGVGVMNYQRDVGWYYNSPNDRAAAWSGAEYFRKFLLNNHSVGPFAQEVNIGSVELGDFVQLNDGKSFYHTLVVTGFRKGVPLVCAHTRDAYMFALSDYSFAFLSALHISGANGE